MIKECLKSLSDSRVDIGDRRRTAIKNVIGYYEEDQLFNIMRTPRGLVVEDINIYYLPNVGFRCYNDETITGKLPMCNIFQRLLNEELNEKK